MTVTRIKLTVIATGLLGLAACAGGPARVASTPSPVAMSVETDLAFELMMRGQGGDARKRLNTVLKRDPNNPNAQLLRDSLDRDAKELLGPQNYPYTVRSGDTILGLAQRFLGNRLKAYQLLRYNDLKAPAVLAAGQTLRLPGEPPRAEPIRRADPAPTRAAPPAHPPATPKPKPAAAKPAAPVANPAAARQARAAGLAALNQGNVARAVALLRRGAALDPGNPLIARDLARAERIAATVRARR